MRSTCSFVFFCLLGSLVTLCPSYAFSVVMQQADLLEIVEQPHDVSVCEGAQAHFSVRVVGHQKPQFQWQSSVDGKHWSDIAGAQKDTYDDLRNLTKVYDGLALRVLVMGDGGQKIISNIAILSVDGPMVCTQSPKSQLIAEGGDIQLNAEFSSKGAINFQWQYSPYGSGTWLDLTGEQNQNLTVKNIPLRNSGSSFRCKASSPNHCAGSEAISESAFVEVIERPQVQLNRGQESYCGGGSSTFTVQMRGGSGRETIQWQESRDAGRTYNNIKDATERSYTINRILETMTGYKYRAVVSMPGGLEISTTEITVTVFGAVVFNKQPESRKVCPADAFTVEARTDVKGSEPVYQWQISKDSIRFEDITGGADGKLPITLTYEDRATRYYRTIVRAGACHSMISDVARIDVLSVDGIEPKVQDAVAAQDTSARYSATINSDFRGDASVYTCTWQWSANDGATWQTMNSPSPSFLLLKGITAQNEGSYQYRLKVLNRVCYRIYYSNAARVKFE